MDGLRSAPLTVEGDWRPEQSRAVRNKLLIHFQSQRRSGGGECRVEAEEGAPRAAVYFQSEEVRERVLAWKKHEIILENQTVTLRLTSAPIPRTSDDVPESSTASKPPEVKLEDGATAAQKKESESCQSVAVLVENVPADISPDLLSMLVETVSGSDEDAYRKEMLESSRVVVTFKDPADAQKFLTASPTHAKMQKHGLTVRPLEATKCIRVENLPQTVIKDMLEMYLEKNWALPDRITMIPEEEAAIVTFTDHKVVESICVKEDYEMRSIPVKVYPYYESLGTALYGAGRPAWKMPEPITENVHHLVWKFLLMKKQLKNINNEMRPHFCCVDLEKPEVKLSPLPALLRQKDLTADQIGRWAQEAKEAFRQLMSHYSAFECLVNPPAWKVAEKDVRSVVKEDAITWLDASRGLLVVAGRVDDIKQIRSSVENIVLKAVNQIERKTNGVSETMNLSPALFYILKQDGLLKAAKDNFPEMNLSYDEGTQKLTASGLHGEVYQTKSWILTNQMNLKKKQLSIAPCLLDFLRMVDPSDLSQALFTSQGISAMYSIESKGVSLSGSSDQVLADAECKLLSVLHQQTLDVEDQEVLKLQGWLDLNQQLLDSYNSKNKKTVAIQSHHERPAKVTVVGFKVPVTEISQNLREFIQNFSQVQETVRVESCAVVSFIDEKKTQDWSRISKDNKVSISFDAERPKIVVVGARLYVLKAKSLLEELARTLFTDTLTVDKPGAKKFFQSHGSMFLSTIRTEHNCVVVLQPEIQEEEEEEDNRGDQEDNITFCKVTTSSGLLVSVSKANICSFSVDAVVNAANEELKHIGGLALALLNAAGPQLQKASTDYVAKKGSKLRAGEAAVTQAYNLPCKYVVHAVGPRFSDFSDKKMAVSCLKMAVKESLRQSERENCSSIALPAISSGVFGFPLELCAETIARAVREFCDNPRGPQSLTKIYLVDNNNNTVRVLAKAVYQEFNDLEPTMTLPKQEGSKGSGTSGYQQGRGHGRSSSNRDQQFSERGGRGGRGGYQGNSGSPNRRGHNIPGANGGLARMEQHSPEGLKIVLHNGNIQDQTTDVIVNSISPNKNLNQGAVSKAIRNMAGPGLQAAMHIEAPMATLPYGEVVITDSFKLSCRKVFHAVCPHWDNGDGQAEEELISIIRFCLEEAERLQMASLSFPALGTGILSFPRDLVSRVLLQEIHSFSRRSSLHNLREVTIVVHPSDSQTVDSFSRAFAGNTARATPRNAQNESNNPIKSPARQSLSESQQTAAVFGQVSSPSLGVYKMQMGTLTLEVLSGDITKDASDAIVNSSNEDFSLKTGVSKAILDGAGLMVELELSHIMNSQNYQPRPVILTTAGKLPSKNIIHVIGQKDPTKIKDIVYSVLKLCEDHKFTSVSFPALGTGQGGASPSAVADAMVEAVVEFVRKKQPQRVQVVKILIFQTAMMAEFHRSMARRQGEEVQEKSLMTKFIGKITSLFSSGEEQPNAGNLVLETEEFEPTVFQLCADNDKALRLAKKKIEDVIVAEQDDRTISNPFLRQLSQDHMDQLKALQRKLTVSIHLDRGHEDQEPKIHLEGLSRDVQSAESEIRELIGKVERVENMKTQAKLVSELVEWQYPLRDGTFVPFDIITNLKLEEAFAKRDSVNFTIHNDKYRAEPHLRKAVKVPGTKEVELLRKDLKVALPPHWDDMKNDRVKLFPVTLGSQEFTNVMKEVTKNGLTLNITNIERVQNVALWQSYQFLKKDLEVKNKHNKNELLLFHGTKADSIDLINNKGFNRSYAGMHGAMYGNGSYFAVDPNYSAQNYAKPYKKGLRRMYLARVLVGDFTQGKQGLITPPSKSGNAADLYDSVTDHSSAPTMYVVFNDIQAYPEYLITFT